MRINTLWLMSWIAAAALVAAPAHAQSELVIDDFTESPYSATLTDRVSWLTDYQTAPGILGGVRMTGFVVAQGAPAYGQSSRLQIRPDGALLLSGGYKSYMGLILGYGWSEGGGFGGLDLNLSGGGPVCADCDRFRLEFDGSDSEMGFLMEVWDTAGHVALLSATESLAGRTTPFHVDFPFAGFVANPESPVDWNHIQFVLVLMQTGNVLGGHDFAMTRITAVSPPPE
jgi:hypothetical protein